MPMILVMTVTSQPTRDRLFYFFKINKYNFVCFICFLFIFKSLIPQNSKGGDAPPNPFAAVCRHRAYRPRRGPEGAPKGEACKKIKTFINFQ